MPQIPNPFEARIQREISSAAGAVKHVLGMITEKPDETPEQRLNYVLGLVLQEVVDPLFTPYYSGNTKTPIPLNEGEQKRTIGEAD